MFSMHKLTRNFALALLASFGAIGGSWAQPASAQDGSKSLVGISEEQELLSLALLGETTPLAFLRPAPVNPQFQKPANRAATIAPRRWTTRAASPHCPCPVSMW